MSSLSTLYVTSHVWFQIKTSVRGMSVSILKRVDFSQYKDRTWLRNWWGCNRGSVEDLDLVLELRGNWFFFEPETGWRCDADRSNGSDPPLFCCLDKMAAAASACSVVTASSNLLSLLEEDDLNRFNRLVLGPEPDPDKDGCRFLMGRLFFTGFGGANREQRFPMKRMKNAQSLWQRERLRKVWDLWSFRERTWLEVQVKVVERKWNGEAGNFLMASQRLYL